MSLSFAKDFNFCIVVKSHNPKLKFALTFQYSNKETKKIAIMIFGKFTMPKGDRILKNLKKKIWGKRKFWEKDND